MLQSSVKSFLLKVYGLVTYNVDTVKRGELFAGKYIPVRTVP
jgi:hypothetical protein